MEKTEQYKYEPFVGVIWGTENPENLAALIEKHPSLLLPLGSRCVLSYQLDFLAQNHIHRMRVVFEAFENMKIDVIIPIMAKYKSKLLKYLEKRGTEGGMFIEPLFMDGEFSVDEVLVALETKIDVLTLFGGSL